MWPILLPAVQTGLSLRSGRIKSSHLYRSHTRAHVWWKAGTGHGQRVKAAFCSEAALCVKCGHRPVFLWSSWKGVGGAQSGYQRTPQSGYSSTVALTAKNGELNVWKICILVQSIEFFSTLVNDGSPSSRAAVLCRAHQAFYSSCWAETDSPNRESACVSRTWKSGKVHCFRRTTGFFWPPISNKRAIKEQWATAPPHLWSDRPFPRVGRGGGLLS